MGLLSIQFSRNFEICKVVVVGVDNGLVWVPYKVRLPSCEGVDNGEKFFVVYVSILLCGVKSSGKESDGMELAFLIPLLKDGANSVNGGVAINCELIFESGLSQDRGSAYSIHKGGECYLVFVVPIKLPSFCTMSDKCVKRCGQHAKSTDVHAIEVQEAEKCLNFLQGRGSFLVLYALDFNQVHSDGVFLDNDTKVFHFGLFELAFLRFEVEVVYCEDAQDIVHHTMV